MNSLRIKIVLSLIGMSIFSIALGSYVSRVLLTDRFEDVVMVRSSEEFSRDVIGYYRNHEQSFEQAYANQTWENHQAVLNETRQARQEGSEAIHNTARFIATDLSGKVWVPNDNYAVGHIISESALEDAIPILDNNKAFGYVVVDGQLLLSGTEAQYLTALTNSLWLSLFVVALVAVPLGFILGKRLTNPINSLTNAIKAMNPKTMHQNVPITSNDEIGLLSQSFNQMSQDLATFVEVTEQQKEKIAENEAIRRQGLVSISHELRTPLYRLVAQAYAMLDGIRALDREEMTKLADSLDHLSELVNDLHHLALSDVHAFSCDIESTDFSMIVRKAIEARTEVFSSKNLNLTASLPEKLVMDGDATRLRQIIENLLSNCIRYTKNEGEISVDLKVSKNFAELVVSDNGPGVPPENLESLFDRFYRVEFSRSRTTGGSGLGLSLVKTCAEIHGGSAEAFLSEAGGLGIRVRIPLHSPTN
jgi:two-component system, OmpR family, sensor histidine kinase BaeS